MSPLCVCKPKLCASPRGCKQQGIAPRFGTASTARWHPPLACQLAWERGKTTRPPGMARVVPCCKLRPLTVTAGRTHQWGRQRSGISAELEQARMRSSCERHPSSTHQPCTVNACACDAVWALVAPARAEALTGHAQRVALKGGLHRGAAALVQVAGCHRAILQSSQGGCSQVRRLAHTALSGHARAPEPCHNYDRRCATPLGTQQKAGRRQTTTCAHAVPQSAHATMFQQRSAPGSHP